MTESTIMATKSPSRAPDVATRLAIASHYGYTRAGEECENAAVSALYLSKVQPGHYFLIRAVRDGYAAAPDKAGSAASRRRGCSG